MKNVTSPSHSRPAHIVLASLIALAGLWGCPGELEDPERFLNGGGCPDVETELFPQRCGQANCHSAEDQAANLDLVSSGLAQRVVNVPASSDCNNTPLASPDAPQASVLYTKLTDTFCGPSQMPVIGDKFTDEELECVAEWLASLPGGGPATSSSSSGGGMGGAGGMSGSGGMGGAGGM